MKQALLIILFLTGFTAVAAQDKSPKAVSQVTETIRLEPQAQQEISEAQRVANEVRAALEAATARYETAQQKVVTAVFKAMADAGLKPREWAVKQDQAGIYFERVKPSEPTGAAAANSRPAPQPGATPKP